MLEFSSTVLSTQSYNASLTNFLTSEWFEVDSSRMLRPLVPACNFFRLTVSLNVIVMCLHVSLQCGNQQQTPSWHNPPLTRPIIAQPITTVYLSLQLISSVWLSLSMSSSCVCLRVSLQCTNWQQTQQIHSRQNRVMTQYSNWSSDLTV